MVMISCTESVSSTRATAAAASLAAVQLFAYLLDGGGSVRRRIAQADERGDGLRGRRAGGRGGNIAGEARARGQPLADLVLQFQRDALGQLRPDARGLGERFVIAAGRGQRNFFRRHDGQDGQRGLGADAGDAGQHLKAVALLLGSKAVERDVVLGDVHNRINGPLLPGGGQGLAGGGGDLDKIADPAAADDDGIQRFLDDFSGKAVDHGVSFFCMVESLPPWGKVPEAPPEGG